MDGSFIRKPKFHTPMSKANFSEHFYKSFRYCLLERDGILQLLTVFVKTPSFWLDSCMEEYLHFSRDVFLNSL